MKNNTLPQGVRTHGIPQRTIYDAKYQASLPGDVARREGEPPVSDSTVNEVYDHLGATYGFFWDVYGRDSIDGQGMPLYATVHYQKNYSNAFWNGQELVLGDGDGKIFNRFSISMEIIANQFALGINQFEARLPYWGQSGSLTASMADVFGSITKQYFLHQTADQADWLMGKDLFTDEINALALRSLSAPGTAYDDPILGKDPQPVHMRDFMKTNENNGGVMINSGIPNHAFYLVATELGGYAWENAGRIWYDTYVNKLKESSDFQDCARLTHETAGELFGLGSREQLAIKMGWDAVGLDVLGKKKGRSLIQSVLGRRGQKSS